MTSPSNWSSNLLRVCNFVPGTAGAGDSDGNASHENEQRLNPISSLEDPVLTAILVVSSDTSGFFSRSSVLERTKRDVNR